MNIIKTGLLLAVLTGLLVAIGNVVGGTGGMVFMFGLAMVMNMGSYWFSDKIAISMSRAAPVDARAAPELHNMIGELAQRAGIPRPRLFVAPDPQPNAFATGRNPQHAAVVVNEGLVAHLSREEVRGVIAHELAHIRNRDTLTMAVAASVAGAISMLSQMAFFMGGRGDDDAPNPFVAMLMFFVAPIAALIVQLAISRTREYEADRLGAAIAGSPMGLASALETLERGANAIPAHVSPSHAPLYIVNPLRGGGIALLFSTHPPTVERVRRLRAMATR